jgi:DNA-binding transcriptional LysR family regulator
MEEGLVCEDLLREPLLAAVPAAHPLAGRGEVALADLAGESFVLFPRFPTPSYADEVIAACADAGFLPQIAQESAEIHTAIGLVAAGMGVTLVPESMRTAHREGVAYLPLSAPVPLSSLHMVTRAGDSSPVLSAFVAVARDIGVTLSAPASKQEDRDHA